MIVIKDMKMPSSCYDCPFAKNERSNDYGSFCECGVLEDYETINLLEHRKHPNCPLVDQEPILDKIRTEIEEHAKINQNLNTDRAKTLCWCLDVIDKYKAESEDKE